MDGGKPQITAAEQVLAAMKLDIPVAGMVKDDNHRTRGLIWKEKEYELSESLNADHLPDELPVDTDWDDIYTHQSTAMERPEFDDREDNRHADTSLKEHMLGQVNLLHFSPVDKLIAYCIVDALDEKGFLDADVEEIVSSVQHLLQQMDYEIDVETDEVLVVLKHIQRLEPIGIGSRNLAECLFIQIDALPNLTLFKKEALILLKHYELLVSNDLNKLIKQTGLNADQLKMPHRPLLFPHDLKRNISIQTNHVA